MNFKKDNLEYVILIFPPFDRGFHAWKRKISTNKELPLKSQVSRLLTNKYNPADLSLKFCFSEEGGKGGGVPITHHVEFSIESRIMGNFFFKPITRHVEGSKYTKLTL